jgi:alginate O-acetyltransferase complex protein AlgJ
MKISGKIQANRQNYPGMVLILVLILLGIGGLFTRWPLLIEVFSPNRTGISFSSLTGISHAYETRFNNNFFLRDQLIYLDYQIRYFLLKETVYPQVVLGKQGWMYYTSEGNLDYYQRVRPLTSGQIEKITINLQYIQEKLNAKGIKFLFVIAPNKETIYPEYLPAGISITGNPTWADQITTDLQKTDVQVLDLRQPLLKSKPTAQIYFKTDTHWNPLGAHVAYTQILDSLQTSFPILIPHPLTDFDQVPERISGDLAGLIHLKDEINEPFTALKARFEKPSRGLKNPPAGQMITVMPDPKLPTAVIFRDSFFNGLQPFISEHFSRVVYVSDFIVNFDLIAEENPQIVILEVAERYLNKLED